MNKQVVISFIYNKKTKSKAGLKAFGNLYFLHSIATVLPDGTMVANNGYFWRDSNEQNRLELINDIEAIPEKDKNNPLDVQFLKMVLRYERGDRYGIHGRVKAPFPKAVFNQFYATYPQEHKEKE